MQTISTIIVNYGTADLTINAVHSVLARHHGGRAVDVHVVDNASPDDSAARLQAAHAELDWGARVTLHLSPDNLGFGRGNNLVLDALKAQGHAPDAVFLLNPDATLENEAIDLLATALEHAPQAGFAGAGISKPDGSAVTAAFRFPSLTSEFSEALSFGPIARLCANKAVPLPPDHPAGPVDWVAGAAVLMRWNALEQTGGFDPEFFLYYEEVDLMKRGLEAGWTCLYVPDARVIHAEGASTGVKSGRRIVPRVPAFWYQSWHYYFRKTHGRVGALAIALARILGAAGNTMLATVRRKPRQVPEAFFGDFTRHVLKPLLQRGS